MSSKPVFTGTYEQWQRLSQTERVYFTPPPKTTPSAPQPQPATIKTIQPIRPTQKPVILQPQKTAHQVTGYSEETLEGASTTQEYATPSSTPITAPLPTSYWRLGTEVPGSQPYVSGKDAPPAAQAPPGYMISKVEMKEIVKEGPGSRVPFEQQVMQVTFKPEPKPLSASATALVGLRLFEDIVLGKTGLQKNEMARTLIQYGPLGEAYFAVGSTASLESNLYGTAGLVGSVVKSVQERKLQWASGFEWIKPEWKTPQMAPTIVSATVSGIMGQPQEAEQMQKLPATYAFGSAFGEVGWGLATYYGTAYAVKGVKSAASFAYEQSGLKYSHAAYKVSEGWDELLGRVYTSPQYQVASEEVANLKQAFSNVGEKISGSPLYQKFAGGYEQVGKGLVKTQPITKSTGIIDVPLPMERVGGNLLVNWEVQSEVFEMGLVPRTSLLTISKLPSELITQGKGLPAYFGGLAMIPKTEIFQLPKEEPRKIETPSTREMTVDGDTIEVWAKQPPKSLYEAYKGEPLSFKKTSTETALPKVNTKQTLLDVKLESELFERIQLTNQMLKQTSSTALPYGTQEADITMRGGASAYSSTLKGGTSIELGLKGKPMEAQAVLAHEVGHYLHYELSRTPEGVAFLLKQGIKPMQYYPTIYERELAAYKLAEVTASPSVLLASKIYKRSALKTYEQFKGMMTGTPNIPHEVQLKPKQVQQQKPEQQPTTQIAIKISAPPITLQTHQEPRNPFTQFSGKPYPFYPTRQYGREEEEQQVISYPASGLRQPQAPTQPQPLLLRNVSAVTEFADVGTRARDTSDLFQVPTVTPALAQVPLQTPRYDIPEPTIPKTPEPYYPPLTIPKMSHLPSPWTLPSGFKFEGFGFDRYPSPRFGLYTSRKKRYPILSSEQFLGM